MPVLRDCPCAYYVLHFTQSSLYFCATRASFCFNLRIIQLRYHRHRGPNPNLHKRRKWGQEILMKPAFYLFPKDGKLVKLDQTLLIQNIQLFRVLIKSNTYNLLLLHFLLHLHISVYFSHTLISFIQIIFNLETLPIRKAIISFPK